MDSEFRRIHAWVKSPIAFWDPGLALWDPGLALGRWIGSLAPWIASLVSHNVVHWSRLGLSQDDLLNNSTGLKNRLHLVIQHVGHALQLSEVVRRGHDLHIILAKFDVVSLLACMLACLLASACSLVAHATVSGPNAC